MNTTERRKLAEAIVRARRKAALRGQDSVTQFLLGDAGHVPYEDVSEAEEVLRLAEQCGATITVAS